MVGGRKSRNRGQMYEKDGKIGKVNMGEKSESLSSWNVYLPLHYYKIKLIVFLNLFLIYIILPDIATW